MEPISGLGIVLSLALYPLVQAATIGYRRLPRKGLHYDKSDLYGLKLAESLRKLDRRFGSRWVLPVSLTLLSLLACTSSK